MRPLILVLLMLCPATTLAADLRLVLRGQHPASEDRALLVTPAGQVRTVNNNAQWQTPLGSVWKLFVHDFLVSRQVPEQAYQCRGQDRDEVYCCEPGGSIARDQALAKSCGLYFAPQRWEITPTLWKEWWQARNAPGWLTDLDNMKPQTRVPVSELLDALAVMQAPAQARRVLLDRLLPTATPGQGDAPVNVLGSRLRVKTWSWHQGEPSQRIGGFAGWLTDGSLVWAQGEGTSQAVLDRYATALERILPQAGGVDPSGGADDVPCVEVTMFQRYPLQCIENAAGQCVTREGPLTGKFTAVFRKGNRLPIASHGEMFLQLDKQADGAITPRLQAALDLEEYVARVIDREAQAEPVAAARALAVAARTYVLQNATQGGRCLQITDSSRHQRVSPLPASNAAREVAAWSRDLVLAGATVTYHLDEAGKQRLVWKNAVQQAGQGWRYDRILAHAFPQANLARRDHPQVGCQPLPEAAQWLQRQLPQWRETLNAEHGYQETREFTVCRLRAGKPFADRAARRIHVRNLLSLQDRLDLTHEYLHLAFDAHPAGMDEAYVESLARRLILE